MVKVCITHHLGHVSPVFDVARHFLVVSIGDGQGQIRQEATLETTDPFLRAQKIKDLGVDVVVCGAISQAYEMALSAKGIKVISFVCGSLEEVLSAFVNRGLRDARFRMPGFCGPRRCRGRYGRGRWGTDLKHRGYEKEDNGS